MGEVVKLDSTPVDEVEWVSFVKGSDGRGYYAPVRHNADVDVCDRLNGEDTAARAAKGLIVRSREALAW